VFSRHNNYWLWGPPPESTRVVLAIDFSREDLEERFEEIVAAGRHEAEHAVESELTIWACRRPRASIAEMWEAVKLFI